MNERLTLPGSLGSPMLVSLVWKTCLGSIRTKRSPGTQKLSMRDPTPQIDLLRLQLYVRPWWDTVGQ